MFRRAERAFQVLGGLPYRASNRHCGKNYEKIVG